MCEKFPSSPRTQGISNCTNVKRLCVCMEIGMDIHFYHSKAY